MITALFLIIGIYLITYLIKFGPLLFLGALKLLGFLCSYAVLIALIVWRISLIK